MCFRAIVRHPGISRCKRTIARLAYSSEICRFRNCPEAHTLSKKTVGTFVVSASIYGASWSVRRNEKSQYLRAHDASYYSVIHPQKGLQNLYHRFDSARRPQQTNSFHRKLPIRRLECADGSNLTAARQRANKPSTLCLAGTVGEGQDFLEGLKLEATNRHRGIASAATNQSTTTPGNSGSVRNVPRRSELDEGRLM